MGSTTAPAWPLTSRSGELDAFRMALADPRQHAYLIYGRAGLGKTRLAEECLALARRRGQRCLRAPTSPAASALPLGTIAHLLPAGADPRDAAGFFAQVAEHLSSPRCAVVLIDDLHWLDATSAVLLGQLMDAGHIFLIATIRDGARLSEAVARLERQARGQRARLAALGLDEVEHLLSAVLGGLIERGTCARLLEASGGVPACLRELVTGALADGALTGDGGVWRLDGSLAAGTIADVAEQRLAAIAPADRAVIEIVALCGTVGTRRVVRLVGVVSRLVGQSWAVHSITSRRLWSGPVFGSSTPTM